MINVFSWLKALSLTTNLLFVRYPFPLLLPRPPCGGPRLRQDISSSTRMHLVALMEVPVWEVPLGIVLVILFLWSLITCLVAWTLMLLRVWLVLLVFAKLVMKAFVI